MMKILLLLALIMVCCHGRQLTIDELIASASTVSNLDYLSDVEGGVVLWDMDMALLIDQWNALQGKDKSRKKRKAIREMKYRWTDKQIPYKMASGVFGENDLAEIQKAMDEWSTYTCIEFVEATSHTNHVFFDDASGCYSYVGMIGGTQTIGLAGGCRYKGVIAHEIGHAVGFHHEQNRPDRDNHVRIVKDNIPENLYYNFKKYDASAVNTYNVPYDYGSIMHYGGRAFSVNGEFTIQTLNSADQGSIGNRAGLSFYDIKLANLMYSCSEKCDASIRCPSHGFLGKDCKCYCPGAPVQACDAETGTEGATKGPTTKAPVTAPPCENLNEHCQVWADAGFCENHQYLQLYCKKACNLCEKVTKATQPPCFDEKEHCSFWKDQGYCTGAYETFMKNHCKKSCDYCNLSSGSDMDTDNDSDGGSKVNGDDKNGVGKLPTSYWAYLSSLVVIFVTFVPTML